MAKTKAASSLPRGSKKPAFKPRPSKKFSASGPKDLIEALARCSDPVIIELVQRKHWPFDRDVIQEAATTYYRGKVFRVIAMILAQQRKQILHKARLLLPESKLQKLDIPDERGTIDGQGIVLAKKLQQCKTMEEAELRYYFPDCKWASCGTSVYSPIECNRDAAHALYAAGFKDVDEADALGHSPISVLEIPDPEKIHHGTYTVGTFSDCLGSYLNMCAWYKKKGARLDHPFGLAQETALHHIASRLGKCSAGILDRWYRKVGNDDQKTIVRRFSSDWISIVRPLKPCILRCIMKIKVHRDLYACACTVGGCLPMNVLINETIKGHRSPKAVSSLACMFLKALWLPDTAEHDQWLAPIFLRACTFACLVIPHTCQSALAIYSRIAGRIS